MILRYKSAVLGSALAAAGAMVLLAASARAAESSELGMVATDAMVAEAQQTPVEKVAPADEGSKATKENAKGATPGSSSGTRSHADAAKDSLAQALKHHVAGLYDDTRSDLKSAAQHFDDAAQGVALGAGKFARDEATTLAQESRDLERKIGAAADKGDEAFAALLNELWQRADAYVKIVSAKPGELVQ